MKHNTARLNGIHYLVQGEGPPVVLIHGMGASLESWFYQIPELITSGYRVHALDLPGHGESQKPKDARSYHINTIFDQFDAWINHLSLADPVVLIGHSVGGYLSLSYAHAYPERVSRLVLIDPFYSSRQLFPFMRLTVKQPRLSARVFQSTPSWVLRSVLNWFKNFAIDHPPEVLQRIFSDYRRSAPQIFFTAPSMKDLTPDLPTIRAPTLILWGKHDLTLAPNSFQALTISLPNASGKGLPNCGHTPHLTQPELFNRLLLDFLASWD